MPQVPAIARDITYASAARSAGGRLLIRGLEAATGRTGLLRRARGYDQALARGACFWEEMAARYGIGLDLVRGHLDAIPATGPCVVVANHPYGILDGLILSLILSRARPGVCESGARFKVIANSVFLQSRDLRDMVLPVSFDDTRAARALNLSMRRDALAFLAQGGLIGVFPGGAVSTSRRPFGPAMDPPWRGFSAKLIRASGATVVPIHFEGANSRLFHLASHLHQTLRAGLLVREFRSRVDSPVRLSAGAPIPPEEIAAQPGNQHELMQWLRARTYATGGAVAAPGYDFDAPPPGCA